MAIGNVKKMRTMIRPFLLFWCVILSLVNLSYCQFDAPRNIEIFYPFPPPPNSLAPAVSSPPSDSPVDFVVSATPPPSRSSKKGIVTAVAATAASAFVLAALTFFLFTTFSKKRRRERAAVGSEGSDSSAAAVAVAARGNREEFKRFDSNVKGYVVDEDGLDVVYWKKLSSSNGGYRRSGSGKPVEVPRGRSPSSVGQIHPEEVSEDRLSNFLFQATPESGYGGGQSVINLPVQQQLMAVPKRPPPPPPTAKKKTSPIPPPPPPALKSAAPPPRPPKLQESLAVAKGASGSGNDQVKLKALHWEKVNINHDQSNVWDKIEKGSFQYNGDMMEALFGVAANKRKPFKEESSTSTGSESAINTGRIFLLDQRRSQNAAIVIRTLGVPIDELIEALLQGKGLDAETLDKLTRIAVTKDEASQILAFNGDPSKLADAESFLYNLLRSVPSAFTRANEMLFRLNYDSEIFNVKDSFQTLESACTDLKSRGIFLKLLEAILKAGNRLNAGTARGNAKAFNLITLRKLSDYKSSDGKTTLLHFVIHEVVRNEGKRCVLMRSNSLSRQTANSSPQHDDPATKEDRENEYLTLGLPVVGGLSSEFSNVKKAANIDYDSLQNTIQSLSTRITFASELVANSASAAIEGGAFLKEMKDFLVSAEMEIKDVEAEHVRVMEEVKKTTQYYQATRGSDNDKNPLQLFAIVKDFLDMVDKACVEIARSVQQRKQPKPGSVSGSEPGSSQSSLLRPRVTFPRLPVNFMSPNTGSDDDS